MILRDTCLSARLSRQETALEMIGTFRNGLHPKVKHIPPCCRLDTSVGLLVREEEPLCRTMGSEPEVYRFIWHSSFDGDAMVRIGRQDENVMLRWWYRPFILIDEPAHDTAAAPADWARFQAQISAVGFWSLAPMDDHQGSDGATWLIEGRRGNEYHRIERWSPGGEVHALGRLFFTLAGPPLSEIQIY
jgi:hypothetical protein